MTNMDQSKNLRSKKNKNAARKVVLRRNPDRSKSSILASAIECFAERGFFGTGINEICERAKISKRMIYHYFKNKEGLYCAVHREIWQGIILEFAKRFNSLDELKEKNPDIKKILLDAVDTFHQSMATHPIFIRLLLWDGLEGGMASKSLWTEVRGPLYHQFEWLLSLGQKSGLIPRKLIPGHLIISLIGAVSFYFSHANTLEEDVFKDPLGLKAIAKRREQILLLFKRILGESCL